LYNPLFTRPDPGADGDFTRDINPNSLEVLSVCRVEPALAGAPFGEGIQFERQGYFCRDGTTGDRELVFNRTVGLRDSK
jgi:glutaminyl-tRNA synthetase